MKVHKNVDLCRHKGSSCHSEGCLWLGREQFQRPEQFSSCVKLDLESFIWNELSTSWTKTDKEPQNAQIAMMILAWSSMEEADLQYTNSNIIYFYWRLANWLHVNTIHQNMITFIFYILYQAPEAYGNMY